MKKLIYMVLCFVLVLPTVFALSSCSQVDVSPKSAQADSSTDSELPSHGTIDPSEIIKARSSELPEPQPEENTIHYSKDQFRMDEVTPLTPRKLSDSPGLEDSNDYVIEFYDNNGGTICSDLVEYDIPNGGSATLYISGSVWIPELSKAEVGIVNQATNETWYMVRSVGVFNDCTCTFTELTAGTYSVYFRNLEGEVPSQLYIRYNLT